MVDQRWCRQPCHLGESVVRGGRADRVRHGLGTQAWGGVPGADLRGERGTRFRRLYAGGLGDHPDRSAWGFERDLGGRASAHAMPVRRGCLPDRPGQPFDGTDLHRRREHRAGVRAARADESRRRGACHVHRADPDRRVVRVPGHTHAEPDARGRPGQARRRLSVSTPQWDRHRWGSTTSAPSRAEGLPPIRCRSRFPAVSVGNVTVNGQVITGEGRTTRFDVPVTVWPVGLLVALVILVQMLLLLGRNARRRRRYERSDPPAAGPRWSWAPRRGRSRHSRGAGRHR